MLPVLPLFACRSCNTQPLIQDATKVLKSPSEWDSLQSNLDIVLTGLAKSPATVAAVHAVGSSELAAATAAAAAAAGDGSNGSSALYLSSYKLFGLQLADSAFRRGFLVQVGPCRRAEQCLVTLDSNLRSGSTQRVHA
jgi:hypothetical protein